MYNYAIQLEEAGTAASCRDLPEFTAMGNTREETISSSYDNLITTLAIYQAIGKRIPAATATRPGEIPLLLPTSIIEKIELTNAIFDDVLTRGDIEHLNGITNSTLSDLSNFFKSSDIQDLQRVTQLLRQKQTKGNSTRDFKY